MRAAEERYPGYPETVPELMERAGAAVARELAAAYPEARRIAVVCGGGSNGGDGRVAARLLREQGLEAEETDDVEGADVVVDALFGTGFHGEPRPEAAERIERINAVGAPVVSVDVPSGVDASTGEIAGAAVQASLTVTFGGPKVGLHVAPGGLPRRQGRRRGHRARRRLPTEHRLVTRDVLALVPLRGPQDTKYSAGSVLVVGGAPGLTGAVMPCGRGSLPRGRRLCRRRRARGVAAGRRGAAARGGQDDLGGDRRRAPEGAGRSRSDRGSAGRTRRVRSWLGCSARSRSRSCSTRTRSSGSNRGTGARPSCSHRTRASWPPARCRERPGSTRTGSRRRRRAAERFGCVCLLKGADTLVAAPGEGVLVLPLAPHALATAGTGDVLTGVVAAFLAKGLTPRLAAAAAATAHAVAASLAPHRAGLVAGDVVAALPLALGG